MRSSTTKRVIFILLAIGLVVGLLLPIFASAQGSPSCDRLASFGTRSDREAGRRIERFRDGRSQRSQNLEDKLESRDQRIEELRQKFDARLEEHIDRLGKRATTREQVGAVDDFAAAVKQAVNQRRRAVDAARQEFLAGVKRAIAKYRESLDSAVSIYRADVRAAVDKAVADCGTGVDPSTVFSELSTAIRAAKDDFRQARTDVEKVGSTVRELTTARREKVQEAQDEFRQAVEAAKDELKDVLGVRAE